jgi:putative ABC transport system permease protein
MFDRRSVFRVLCEARSSRDVDAAKSAILAVLRDRHGGQEDVTVLTQDAVMKTFGKVLAILTAALAGIAAVSLTVAGVGIMNVMLVSVSERTREVGLLKALGASRGQVLGAFLVEAALLDGGRCARAPRGLGRHARPSRSLPRLPGPAPFLGRRRRARRLGRRRARRRSPPGPAGGPARAGRRPREAMT